MLKLQLAFWAVTAALWLFALIDVITSDDGRIRHLPKTWWLLIVLFFPFVGSVAWLVAGRPENARRRDSRHERSAPAFPEYDRPGRAAATTAEGDDEFLAQVRERAEKQRKAYREKLERERRAQEDPPPTT